MLGYLSLNEEISSNLTEGKKSPYRLESRTSSLIVDKSQIASLGPILLEVFGPILRGWYLVGSYQDGRWNGRRHSRHVPRWIKGNGEEKGFIPHYPWLYGD
ncbi:hypothetical protein TNIN_319101 [Trichonephila inaurata madagascariensis]|uniref:Uncharacterized protein n=1 Tax=Trichonephila inaurata madagascariensis TaxID=2747483 RepID=A0A8X6IUA3_9ARAC|nr:hypothetical protein TNIN_319101 [Trichonephila inaurata madagascariensis]